MHFCSKNFHKIDKKTHTRGSILIKFHLDCNFIKKGFHHGKCFSEFCKFLKNDFERVPADSFELPNNFLFLPLKSL